MIKNTSLNSEAGKYEVVIKVNGEVFQKARFQTGPLPGCSDELTRPSGWKANKMGVNLFDGFIFGSDGSIRAKCQKIVIVR